MFKKIFSSLIISILTFSCVDLGEKKSICVDEISSERPLSCQKCGVHGCQVELDACNNDDECSKFEHCYENSQGALNGDASECIEKWPEGARIWLSFVDCVCEHCCISCYDFCQSPYGVIKP